MTDIKSKILSEAEENLGSHAVMVIADAMERCPTLKRLFNKSLVCDLPEGWVDADTLKIFAERGNSDFVLLEKDKLTPKEAYAKWDEETRKELNERFDDD